jgi:hypothetical protein
MFLELSESFIISNNFLEDTSTQLIQNKIHHLDIILFRNQKLTLNEQKLLDAIFVYKTRSEIMNFLE